nr:hypothetical protein [uncultured Desulfobulbus sp.]
MSSQQIPPFTPEALALLFRQDTFLAFQKPGFPSHYWAPLLAACCGASRNEVFFLLPADLMQEQGVWFLTLRKLGIPDALTRRIPLHPWLQQLGLIDFILHWQQTRPHDRLFCEYRAGQESAGMLFSRNFVQWIKTTVATLSQEEQQLFAADFHFPSLRALFWQLVEEAELSPQTVALLHGQEGKLVQAAEELATLPIQECFPAPPNFKEIF